MREDVLVVIPCLNEEAHLPRLLDGLLRHARGETIVVADGGSTDRSRRIVADLARRSSRLHLLDNPAKLQSAAVNLAARRFGAGARWLVRIDAHCDYPDDYVGALLAAAMARRATSVVVPMVSVGRGCFQRAAAAAQNSVLGTGGSPHRHLGRGGNGWIMATMRCSIWRATLPSAAMTSTSPRTRMPSWTGGWRLPARAYGWSRLAPSPTIRAAARWRCSASTAITASAAPATCAAIGCRCGCARCCRWAWCRRWPQPCSARRWCRGSGPLPCWPRRG
ncbi:glycosyltransferase [Novosphingobium colocasiae]